MTASLVDRLDALNAAPKTWLGNGRVVSQPQLDEYYAMHDAWPAISAAVKAALELVENEDGPTLDDIVALQFALAALFAVPPPESSD